MYTALFLTAIMVLYVMIVFCSTLAEVSVLEMMEGGDIQPALSRESLLQLVQSSQSFFGHAGYTLTVIQGMYRYSRDAAPPTIGHNNYYRGK